MGGAQARKRQPPPAVCARGEEVRFFFCRLGEFGSHFILETLFVPFAKLFILDLSRLFTIVAHPKLYTGKSSVLVLRGSWSRRCSMAVSPYTCIRRTVNDQPPFPPPHSSSGSGVTLSGRCSDLRTTPSPSKIPHFFRHHGHRRRRSPSPHARKR